MIFSTVPPVIDIDPRYKAPQEVKRGSTLVLPVNYTGVPRPKATWFHRGIPLNVRHGHIHIDSGDAYSTLTILVSKPMKVESTKLELRIFWQDSFEYDVLVKCKKYNW